VDKPADVPCKLAESVRRLSGFVRTLADVLRTLAEGFRRLANFVRKGVRIYPGIAIGRDRESWLSHR